MKARKELRKIKVYKPGKPIEEVKRALGLANVYKLASNEIPFPPFYIKKSILQELKNINRYPESSCFYLRKAIAEKFKVDEDQIVFGNGSDEIITLTMRAFVDKGDEIAIAFPTFLMYEIQATAQGAKIIKIPLKNFRYSLADMVKKITPQTKVVFIANPDNPTGSYVTDDELKTFLQAIPKNVLVYLDEAYFEFAPKDFPNSKKFLDSRGNIIFVRTFSKAYGLAGLRIGYGISSKEIANALNTIREPFNINRFAQVAAAAALKNNVFLRKVTTHVAEEKRYLYQELKRLEIFFIESATNFVLIDFKKDAKEVYDYLLKRGIIVRDLSDWGFKNFFRVTVGTRKENKLFIKSLKDFLGKQGGLR